MKALHVIKSKEQYIEYCDYLETLSTKPETTDLKNEMELLELLIDKYNESQFNVNLKDPIFFLKELMETHEISQQELANELLVSKSTMSLILNYQRGLSKNIIRKLSEKFSVRQEVFNLPYRLKGNATKRKRKVVA